MFTIFLSLVFTTCILAIPAPVPDKTSKQWSKYKDDPTLERFHSTLLNESFLPFLNECYSNQGAQTKDIVCSRYIDAILQLNNTNYSVHVPTVQSIRYEGNITSTFCEEKHNFPSSKYLLDVPRRDFNNLAVCGKLCLEDDATTPKPICRFLAWMGDELRKNSANSSVKHDAAVVVPQPQLVVKVTPEPAKIQLADVALKNVQVMKVFPNKTFEPVQVKTTETAKTDSIAEKPVFNASKVPTKATQPNTLAEVPIEEKPKPIENKQPIDEKQLIDDKQPIEEQQTQIKEAPIEIKTPKEKVTSDEAKDDIALATLNTSAQDPIKQLESSKIKTENTDSEPIDTDEDANADENEDYNMNIKPEKVDIVNPDNELNHSSKQEIITSDVITAINNKKIDPFHEQSGSNFFTYFLIGMFLCIAMYVSYHNKSKILALVLEGRRGDKGRNGRRKHTAAYRKLDSNLEEAITSSTRGRTTQIIY